MDKVGNAESQIWLEEQLLGNAAILPTKKPKTAAQRAIRKTFKGTANLSNLLPTGSVLAFQIMSPILTHKGQCPDTVSLHLTLAVLFLCSISCFIVCFTDSIRDERGKVRYGLATFRGLWVIDGFVTLPAEDESKYKIRFLDFVHAVLSVLVFATVALFDENVVKCFDPNPSVEEKEVLVALPLGIGVVCSFLFVAFPSQRRGIGFPLSRS